MHCSVSLVAEGKLLNQVDSSIEPSPDVSMGVAALLEVDTAFSEVSIPAACEDCEELLVIASDRLDSDRKCYKGSRGGSYVARACEISKEKEHAKASNKTAQFELPALPRD